MDLTIQTLSMLLGMAAGLVQAFDIPATCPSLSGPYDRGRTEVSQTLQDGIPLWPLMERDWTGVCTASNGLAFDPPLPYPEAAWAIRRA